MLSYEHNASRSCLNGHPVHKFFFVSIALTTLVSANDNKKQSSSIPTTAELDKKIEQKFQKEYIEKKNGSDFTDSELREAAKMYESLIKEFGIEGVLSYKHKSN